MNWRKFSGAGVAALLIFMAIMTLAPRAISQDTYELLRRFGGGKTGAFPFGDLIFDQSGNLYGTTSSSAGDCGGYGGCGVVFELTPQDGGRWKESVLYTFQYVDPAFAGFDPQAGLVFDQAGNLYGTTVQGGYWNFYCKYGCGTVFELTPGQDGTWTYSTLYTFGGGDDGRAPQSGLIFDQAGNLYGTTSGGGLNGGGVVFSLTPQLGGAWTENVLFNFGPWPGGGMGSTAGLVFDGAGNLYGTTQYGGTASCGWMYGVPYPGCGTVFQLSPGPGGAWTGKVLYTFCSLADCADGSYPVAGLVLDQAGNLYGTTRQGGDSYSCGGLGCGLVFSLTPSTGGSWTESVLYRFTGRSDGGNPYSGLTFSSAGDLYGTTILGGHGTGTVFKLVQSPGGGWQRKLVHAFAPGEVLGNNTYDPQGSFPYAGVIFDSAGNLYGMTTGNPDEYRNPDFGTVFEIIP